MKKAQKIRVQKTAFFYTKVGVFLSLCLGLYAIFYLYTSLFGCWQGLEPLYAVVSKGIGILQQALLGAGISLGGGAALFWLSKE